MDQEIFAFRLCEIYNEFKRLGPVNLIEPEIIEEHLARAIASYEILQENGRLKKCFADLDALLYEFMKKARFYNITGELSNSLPIRTIKIMYFSNAATFKTKNRAAALLLKTDNIIRETFLAAPACSWKEFAEAVIKVANMPKLEDDGQTCSNCCGIYHVQENLKHFDSIPLRALPVKCAIESSKLFEFPGVGQQYDINLICGCTKYITDSYGFTILSLDDLIGTDSDNVAEFSKLARERRHILKLCDRGAVQELDHASTLKQWDRLDFSIRRDTLLSFIYDLYGLYFVMRELMFNLKMLVDSWIDVTESGIIEVMTKLNAIVERYNWKAIYDFVYKMPPKSLLETGCFADVLISSFYKQLYEILGLGRYLDTPAFSYFIRADHDAIDNDTSDDSETDSSTDSGADNV